MKKVLKIIGITLAALICLALLLCLAGCIVGAIFFAYDFNLPVTEILRTNSPDGKYIVIVEQLGTPDWSFGPVTCRVTVKNTENGKRVARFKDEVMNDGTELYDRQFEFEWISNKLIITIDPSEGENIVHEITFE